MAPSTDARADLEQVADPRLENAMLVGERQSMSRIRPSSAVGIADLVGRQALHHLALRRW